VERAHYWQFKQAILGLGDAARSLSIPVVGGNVSLYNESGEYGTAIAPTPSIGLIGITGELETVPQSHFTGEGNTIILVGNTLDEMGGSEYYNMVGLRLNGNVPKVTDDSVKVIETLINVVMGGDVVAAHDVSACGLVVALSEMCGFIGAEIDLNSVGDNLRADDILFSESHARAILVTSSPEKVKEMLVDVPHTVIGTVGGNNLGIKGDVFDISLSLEEISDARASLTKLMME